MSKVTAGVGAEIFNDYDNNKAIGDYSAAEGSNTIAKGNCQKVFGKYNIIDTENKYALIIGNGTKTEDGTITRSNALAIDWDGKLYIGNSQTGIDVSTINIPDLSDYVTSQLLESKGYLTSTDLSGYVTEDELNEQISGIRQADHDMIDLTNAVQNAQTEIQAECEAKYVASQSEVFQTLLSDVATLKTQVANTAGLKVEGTEYEDGTSST